MANISLQVIQGADRGKFFANLPTPITIGREEGNTVQLNDERISRYHIKIQEDNDNLVLTDLDSTNGTQVNGHDCQLRIIRIGDIISMGRSVLLVGSKEQIAEHVESLTATGEPKKDQGDVEQEFEVSPEAHLLAKQLRNLRENFSLPDRLSPCQSAQLSELLEVILNRISSITNSTKVSNGESQVNVSSVQWQLMLELASKLGVAIRELGDPHAG